MANTYVTKTFSGNGSATTHTLSMWVKRGNMDSMQKIFFIGAGSHQHQVYFAHYPAGGMYNNLQYEFYNGTNNYYIRTNRRFQDTNSWYHIVAVWDTTNATSGDRMRLYVNGVRETSFAAEAQPTQNFNGYCNQSTYAYRIGASDTGQNFDGVISHLHSIDGTAYNASTFGSTDSVTGEWQINTSPSITMGTNGFTILKDGNTITDQSSNSNDFTLGGGTLTPTEDCPSNVFATFNPLIAQTGATFSNGNTFVYRSSAGNVKRIGCTIGATSGKYYAEFQLGTNQWGGICLTNGGDIERTELGNNGYMGEYAADKSVGVRQDGLVYSSGANVTSSQWNQGSLGATDKLCLALDLDNKKLFLGKNGTWSSSSNPATNTGGITLTGDSYTFCGATDNADCKINTGNGYFGTDAISSEGTNASGIGKFEYDVPANFTALSTKGLNL